MAYGFPLGFGGRLFVLNTMREAEFEDLLSKLVHNLIKTTEKTRHSVLSPTGVVTKYYSCIYHRY